MALGKNLRKLRLARGWELEDLSRRSGVKVGTISAIEVRDSRRSEFAPQLALAFGLTMEQLLSDDITPYMSTPIQSAPFPKNCESDVQIGSLQTTTEAQAGNEVVIYEYDTGGRMGDVGIILRDQPGVIRSWTVSNTWISLNVHRITNAGNLAIVTGFGDSMQPLYNPGDPLLIDCGIRSVDADGIYFFRVDNEGFVKRLQRVPGQGILVISDNSRYRDWTITNDMDFEVFGRVVKAWRGEEF